MDFVKLRGNGECIVRKEDRKKKKFRKTLCTTLGVVVVFFGGPDIYRVAKSYFDDSKNISSNVSMSGKKLDSKHYEIPEKSVDYSVERQEEAELVSLGPKIITKDFESNITDKDFMSFTENHIIKELYNPESESERVEFVTKGHESNAYNGVVETSTVSKLVLKNDNLEDKIKDGNDFIVFTGLDIDYDGINDEVKYFSEQNKLVFGDKEINAYDWAMQSLARIERLGPKASVGDVNDVVRFYSQMALDSNLYIESETVKELKRRYSS